jgi:hypothetical protein
MDTEILPNIGTKVEDYWLAGLLEGQGSFVIHNGEVAIVVQMSDRILVERAALAMGETARFREPTAYKQHLESGLVYVAKVGGAAAIEIMERIKPVLSLRRQRQIARVLAERTQIVSNFRERMVALCHPEREHRAKGMCKSCYDRHLRKKRKQTYQDGSYINRSGLY